MEKINVIVNPIVPFLSSVNSLKYNGEDILLISKNEKYISQDKVLKNTIDNLLSYLLNFPRVKEFPFGQIVKWITYEDKKIRIAFTYFDKDVCNGKYYLSIRNYSK